MTSWSPINRTYTANGLNQYTASGPVTLGYDARGNVASSGTDTFTYSSENLLTSAPGGVSLTYDPLGRLRQVVSPNSNTRFLYDGLDLIGEYDRSGLMTRRYVHGPGLDQPLVWYEGGTTSDRRFLLADERGSVVAVPNSSGGLIGTNRYDEYGIPAATNIGRFQYTGQTWLPEVGLYYYKARMYSPALGRFMQTDPIGYANGLNWYNYVRGDPVNWVDPSGLSTHYSGGRYYVEEVVCGGRIGGEGGSPSDIPQIPAVKDHEQVERAGGEGESQKFDPPCKLGLDCKLPTPPNRCTIANNYCGPKPPPPILKPPTDWKHVRTCLGAGGAFAAGVAFVPETFGGSLAAVLMGGAAIQQCADN